MIGTSALRFLLAGLLVAGVVHGAPQQPQPAAQQSTSTPSSAQAAASGPGAASSAGQQPGTSTASPKAAQASAGPTSADPLSLQADNSAESSRLRQSASGEQASRMSKPASKQAAGDPFSGRNPFLNDGDDNDDEASLWRIPIQLVRGLSGADNDQLGARAAAAAARAAAPDAAPAAAADSDADALDSSAEASSLADESESVDEPDYLVKPSLMSSSSRSALTSQPSISTSSSDLKAAAAGYHYPAHHGAHYGSLGAGHADSKYYQYASVPKPYAWESGYRRGNSYHTIERHERAKGPHFQAKVKWNDKNKGYGLHIWDYNHDDDHHHQHHHKKDHYEKHTPYHHGGHHAASQGHGVLSRPARIRPAGSYH